MTDALRDAAAKPVVAAGDRPAPTMRQLVEKQKDEVARALGNDPKLADAMVRAILTEMSRTPKLAQCTPQSMLGAVMVCAHLALEPGPMNLISLIPFENKRKSRAMGYPVIEVTIIIQYRGMIELALRSGLMTNIEARAVYKGDHFVHEYGLNPRLEHTFDVTKPRPTNDDDILCWYGIARFANGEPQFLVLTKDDINKTRARARASEDGPWVTDYASMGMKTVIRRMEPFLPKSTKMATAFATDGRAVSLIGGEQIIESDYDQPDEPEEKGADGGPIDDAEVIPNEEAKAEEPAPTSRSRRATATAPANETDPSVEDRV